jgi:hypothetical protein
MSVWNWLKDSFCYVRDNVNELYGLVGSYYRGKHHTWLFITGHTLPLPLSHIHNQIDAQWIYSNYSLTSLSKPCDTVCKISWLSAKICIIHKDNEKEYDIDPFLQNFKLHTHLDTVPTLTSLFLSWCAETRQWFRPDCIVQFHVIDHEGAEQMLTLRADNNCFEIRDQKLYHQLHYEKNNILESHNAYTYYHA